MWLNKYFQFPQVRPCSSRSDQMLELFLSAVGNKLTEDFLRYIPSNISSRFWLGSHTCGNMVLNGQVYMLDLNILVNERKYQSAQ